MKKAAIMITLLLFPRLLAAETPDFSALEGEKWYGLYMNHQKCGYAMHNLEVQEDGSVAVSEDARFVINMFGVNQDIRIASTRTYGPDGALQTLSSLVRDPTGVKEFRGAIQGNELVLQSVISDEPLEERFPNPGESLEDMLKQVDLVRESPQIGDQVSFSMFEPMYKQVITGTSEIVGVEERFLQGVRSNVYKIHTRLEGIEIDTVSYVTGDGTTLEDVIAGGIITMRLEPEELAKDVDYSNDVIVSNAAMLASPIEDARNRERLQLLLTGPLEQGHLFSDERQTLARVEDGVLFTGRRIDLSDFEAAVLPITEESVQQWLEATTFIQSGHPELIEKAREIVDGETNAFEAASKISRWVSRNVTSTFSAQLSNALEVLRNLEGDCTEHSVLFVGLCRAAGIPAREVAGLVYVEGPKPGFYFHQWAKVWVGKWVDVDPTFDQPLADVTHIKLSEGDLFEQARLIPIIGQIRVEVVEEPAAAG